MEGIRIHCEKKDSSDLFSFPVVQLAQEFAGAEDGHGKFTGEIEQVMVVSYEGVHLPRDRSGQHLGVVRISGYLDAHLASVALDDFRRLYETLQEI
jgi:hypothetical protein